MTPMLMSERRRRQHKLRNAVHTAVLLLAMLFVFGTTGAAIWGGSGLIWAVLGGGAALLLSPRVAPELVMRLYRARPLTWHDFPDGYRLLALLAERAQLPRTPQLYYLPSRMLNAFAVGRPEASAIAVTDGLLRTLSPRELAAVLAHELSHVRNNDLRVMTLADTITRVVGLMAWCGQLLLILNIPLVLTGQATVPWLLVVVLLVAPTGMALLQLALSRAREFDADLDAAGLTGDPHGLALALRKLERYQGRGWEQLLLPGRQVPEPSLLRTHPPTEERIRRLLALYEATPTAPFPSAPLGLPHGMAIIAQNPRWRWPGVWW